MPATAKGPSELDLLLTALADLDFKGKSVMLNLKDTLLRGMTVN